VDVYGWIDTLDETEMIHIRGMVERLREQALTIVQELEQLEKRLAMYQSYEP
jgi:hypothetical protein